MSAPSESDLYNELCCYTLGHPDPSFLHQHVVDAYTAQHADETTKPIALTFALVGLYLHEEGFTGKQIQRTHMNLAKQKQTWPKLALPRNRGAMTVADVIQAPEGVERDHAIHAWCASVWDAFRENEASIAALLPRSVVGVG